ncbi:MAG: prepilin-type N-terminal cleavage/methylation domain-containing protein [Pseudomonadota bacterium]
MLYSNRNNLSARYGFSLFEIAIAMFIFGILASAGASLIKPLMERKLRNETVDYLNQVKEAAITFAEINERLPWADTNNDGWENSGATGATPPYGILPYLTLNVPPGNSNFGTIRYRINTNLSNPTKAANCNALRTIPFGAGAPALSLVDYNGATTSFPVAAIFISSGVKDVDSDGITSDGNLFDRVTTGTHQGNNTNGIPNYIKDPSIDDIVVYITGNELCGHLCPNPYLTVTNGPTTNPVWVRNVTQGVDIGSVAIGTTLSYMVRAGDLIQIRNLPNGTGADIIPTSPAPDIPPSTCTMPGTSLTITVP